MFYHGTPTRPVGPLEPRPALIRGVYGSPSPHLAALYAAEDGWIVPFALKAGARVLDLRRTNGVRHMTPEDAAAVREACRLLKIDYDRLDMHAPMSVNNPRPNGEGLPAWESLVRDLALPNGQRPRAKMLGTLMQAAGYDAVMDIDDGMFVHGDMVHRFHKRWADREKHRVHAKAMERVLHVEDGPRDFRAFPVIAVLDAAALTAGEPVPAGPILEALANGSPVECPDLVLQAPDHARTEEEIDHACVLRPR